MDIVRWCLAVPLFALFLWVATLNAIIVWVGIVRRRPAPSWIPFLSGFAGAIAMWVAPKSELRAWSWIPLLLDWGCIPGFVYTLCFLMAVWLRRK